MHTRKLSVCACVCPCTCKFSIVTEVETMRKCTSSKTHRCLREHAEMSRFLHICHVTGVSCKKEIDVRRINKTTSQITKMKPVGELRAQLQPQLGLLLLILSLCASSLALSLSPFFSLSHTHTRACTHTANSACNCFVFTWSKRVPSSPSFPSITHFE